jgi:hypothetical protein
MIHTRIAGKIKQLVIAGIGVGFLASVVFAPVALAMQNENMNVRVSFAQAQGAEPSVVTDSSGKGETSLPSVTNLAPVITGVGGPTELAVNEVGTWSVSAYDPDGAYLNYSVDWDDVRPLPLPMMGMPERIQQTAELSHQYAYAGVYTIVFKVTDNNGAQAQTRITTRVQGIPVAEPTVALSYDAASPKSHVVFPGEKQVGLVTYRISVDNGVFNLPSFDLNLLDTASALDMGTVYVYSNGALMGRGIFNAYGQVHFQLPIIIPSGTSQVWEIKADVSDRAQPGHRIALGLSALEFPTQPEFAFTKIPHGWSNPMTIVYDNPLLPVGPSVQKEASSSKITAGFAQTIGFAKQVAARFFSVK